MAWTPTIVLYEDDGSTPVYTFANVLDLPNLFTDNPGFVEHQNLRSQGSIVIAGGDKAYSFTVRGVITAANYTALATAMNALKTAITNNTNFVLKIDTSVSTTEDINVKRVSPIIWEGPARKTKIQYYTIEFLANSWA